MTYISSIDNILQVILKPIVCNMSFVEILQTNIKSTKEISSINDIPTDYILNANNSECIFDLNYDLMVRDLYVCNETGKKYEYKKLPPYKYLRNRNIANNYKNVLQCHVEFIILKYMLITELKNESFYFRTHSKSKRNFIPQYNKIAYLFEKLSLNDADIIDQIIFYNLYTVMKYINFNELFSNIGDYCECIIDLLLLFVKKYPTTEVQNRELSYDLTYFLIINPNFKLSKIKKLQEFYVLNKKLLSKYKYSIYDITRCLPSKYTSSLFRKFYFYNIYQIKNKYNWEKGLLFKNEHIFVIELIIKIILEKYSDISCFLFRYEVMHVIRFIVGFNSKCYEYQYTLSQVLVQYINDHIYCKHIHNKFLFGIYIDYNLNRSLRIDLTGGRPTYLPSKIMKIRKKQYFHCAFIKKKYYKNRDILSETNNKPKYYYDPYYYYYDYYYNSKYDYDGKWSDEFEFCGMCCYESIHGKSYVCNCDRKIINFNPKSKFYKKFKSRNFGKSRNKTRDQSRRKNKSKIKQDFRNLIFL